MLLRSEADVRQGSDQTSEVNDDIEEARSDESQCIPLAGGNRFFPVHLAITHSL